MESTYTDCYKVKTQQNITKNDIITLCNLLNEHPYYLNVCTFLPEKRVDGGIGFKFKDNQTFYKAVRFCILSDKDAKWYFIKDNVLSEWTENSDIVFNTNKKFVPLLKSFYGAPLFTIEELKIWEQCFNQIGITRVGKYPTKKSLKIIM